MKRTKKQYEPIAPKRTKKRFEPEAPYAVSPLVDAVIEHMKKQIEWGDWTAIDELLRFVPRKYLIGFLDEEDAEKFK